MRDDELVIGARDYWLFLRIFIVVFFLALHGWREMGCGFGNRRSHHIDTTGKDMHYSGFMKTTIFLA
jgi:hypothetical protein